MVVDLLALGWADWLVVDKYVGNELWRWASLLGMLLGSLIAGKVTAFALQHQANRLAKVDGWIVLELLLRCVERPMILLFMAGGLQLAGDTGLLVLAPDVAKLWAQVTHALTIFEGGWFIYRLVDIVELYLRSWTSRTDTLLDDQLVPLIRKSLRVFVVILVLLFVADNVLQWDIKALIAGLGIGGLALALASKDALGNLFGSVTIFADRPFHMGDRVKIDGQEGNIEEVGFRSTRIRTLTGHLVTIPNATVANHTIENVSRRPFLKRVLNVGVTYDTPPEKLKRAVDILREMLDGRKDHFPETNPPRVFFSDFNADNLNIVVYYWFTPPDWWDYLQFNHDFNMELLQRFNAEGIEFAFPTQTVYVKRDDGKTPDAENSDDGAPRSGQAYT